MGAPAGRAHEPAWLPSMGRPTLWSCGILGKAHGLRGELYLRLAPEGLERLRRGERFYLVDEERGELLPVRVTRLAGTAERPIVALDVAGSRDEALALQGRELVAAGGDLDGQPHYRVGDLLGLPVTTAAGRPVGTVGDVLEAPAHELLAVRTADGRELLVPLVDALVEVADGVVRVADGLLDDELGREGRR